MSTKRRTFLKQVTLASAATQAARRPKLRPAAAQHRRAAPEIAFPRVFTGRHLTAIAFPLGGVGAGSISLGGRGQLRDWEIFNRPDKGNAPSYAFPAIWAQAGNRKPVARVLESRIQPPYEGSSGLGSNNAPGLTRLASRHLHRRIPAGAHRLRRFRACPSSVSLEAFSPFIPHDPDESGLPVAILRYRVTNPGTAPAKVSIAWSIDNPTGRTQASDTRVNEYRTSERLAGILMTSPELPADDPLKGSFAALRARLRRRPRHLSARLGAQPLVELAHVFLGRFFRRRRTRSRVRRTPGPSAPSRSAAPSRPAPTPTTRSCSPGISPTALRAAAAGAPRPGDEDTFIGNHYTTRFADAWAAAEYAAEHLESLEKKTRRFAAAMRESTIPAAIKDAASANLSTLVTPVCFRTADGEFHGFEGANDHAGCCLGNCTHVWNYETATAHLFPSFARSLRGAPSATSSTTPAPCVSASAFPTRDSFGFAAADGQMGQIMHAYLDWRLSGDTAWLREHVAAHQEGHRVRLDPGRLGRRQRRRPGRRAAQHLRRGVLRPQSACAASIYLGALRAGEEMARAVGDTAAAAEYRRRLRARQQVDRRQPLQRRILHPESPRRRQGQDRASPAQRHGLRQHREPANTRWATAACSIS